MQKIFAILKEKYIIFEVVLLSLYKVFFDLCVMPAYFDIFSYMHGYGYKLIIGKWIVSNIVFILLLFLLEMKIKKEKKSSSFVLRLYSILCVIPCLSLFSGIECFKYKFLVLILIFWFIFMCLIKFIPYAANSDDIETTEITKKEKKLVNILIVSIIAFSFFAWIWYGCPIVTGFSDANAQRLLNRENQLPTILGYAHIIIGGVGLPFFIAYGIEKRNKFWVLGCLFAALLMFFTNGMKTWLLNYIFIFVFLIADKIVKKDAELFNIGMEIMVVFTSIVSVAFCKLIDLDSLIGIFGRITIVPNTVGLKSLEFFETNELLYLRESVLRFWFDTPYKNGSDFYIFYGENSDITSSRWNNGLWGDAFRNFGVVGMFTYPIIIGITIKVIEICTKDHSQWFQNFMIFILIWSGINTAYFAWLLSGGVIFLALMSKIFAEKKVKV